MQTKQEYLQNSGCLNLIDFSTENVDQNKSFVPETLTHLYYTNVYNSLNEEEKLHYNQVHGLLLCEQFIFLEEYILIPAMRRLIDSGTFAVQSSLCDACEQFILEEYQHSEMFWRLLKKARPAKYEDRDLVYLRRSQLSQIALKTLVSWPQHLTAWVWLAHIFEERTVNIYRQYRKAPHVDALFAKVHKIHMVEETTHISLDAEIIRALFVPQSLMMKRINIWILRKILQRLTSPYYTALLSFTDTASHFPRLTTLLPRVEKELHEVGMNSHFQELQYSREVFPKSFSLMDQFEEMRTLNKALPLYEYNG